MFYKSFFKQLLLLVVLAIVVDGSRVMACDGKTAIIAGRDNYPPLSWGYEGNLQGSSIEIAKLILKQLSVESKTDEILPWKRNLLRAKTGEVDMLVGVRKTDDRLTYLDFVEPPLTPAVQSIFYVVDRPLNIHQWSDLKSKTGSIALGSSFGHDFDEFMHRELDIEYVESIEQNFDKLLKNRSDYMIGSLMTTNLYLEKRGLTGTIINYKKPVAVLNEYIAISKKSPCRKLAKPMGDILTEQINSGAIDELLEQQFIIWFNQHLNMDGMQE